MTRMSADVDVVSAEAGTVTLKFAGRGGRGVVWHTDEKNTAKMAKLVGTCQRVGLTLTGDYAEDGKSLLVSRVTVSR